MNRRGLLLLLVGVLTLPAFGQYCAASLGTACAGSPYFDEYIANVSVAGLTNPTGCTANPAYSNYTAVTGSSLTIGVASQITVSVGNYWSSDSVQVYCDWNGNGVFTDAGEFTNIVDPVNGTPSASGNTNPGYIGSLTPPAGSVASVRMRVILRYGNVVANSCPTTATDSFGEIEDYTLCTVNCPPPSCALHFSSPNGPGSIKMDHTACPALAGAAYFTAFTFVPGAFPSGWWFGLDIGLGDLINWYNMGYPFTGGLDGTGAATFGPTGPGFLPSGFQFWSVSTQWAPGFTQFLLAYAPKTYTIP